MLSGKMKFYECLKKSVKKVTLKITLLFKHKYPISNILLNGKDIKLVLISPSKKTCDLLLLVQHGLLPPRDMNQLF